MSRATRWRARASREKARRARVGFVSPATLIAADDPTNALHRRLHLRLRSRVRAASRAVCAGAGSDRRPGDERGDLGPGPPGHHAHSALGAARQPRARVAGAEPRRTTTAVLGAGAG